MKNETALLIIIVLNITTLHVLYPISARAEWEPILTRALQFQFSGSNQSGIVACPWYVNESSQELLGINEQFRSFFENEVIKLFRTNYSEYIYPNSSIFEYSNTHNCFKDQKQYMPVTPDPDNPYRYDSSEFDPFFAELLVYRTAAGAKIWNNTLGPELIRTFKTTWYVDDVLIRIHYSHEPIPCMTIPVAVIALILFGTYHLHRRKI